MPGDGAAKFSGDDGGFTNDMFAMALIPKTNAMKVSIIGYAVMAAITTVCPAARVVAASISLVKVIDVGVHV